MKSGLNLALLARLALFSLAVALLGIAPRPHAYRQALEQARLALEGHRQGSAAEHLAAAATLAPWRADLWELAGVHANLAADRPAALEYLNRARNAGNGQLSPHGWMVFGDALWAANPGSGDAFAAWEKALELENASVDVLHRMEDAYIHQGNLAAVVAVLRRRLALEPDEPFLSYRLGLFLAVLSPEEALDALDHAAQSDQLEKGYKDAAADIRRALISARFAESSAYTRLTVGRALANAGEWGLAAESFRLAVHDRPDYAEAWAYLGEARQHGDAGNLRFPQRSSSDGLQELQTAIELDPASLAARTFLALYWTRRGNSAQALETMRAAAALDPNNPALQVQFARLLAETGDLSGAQQAYERAIDLSPYDPAYPRALVDFCLEYDYQVDELALPLARRLAARYPDDPPTLELMGRALLKQNDLAGAERFLLRAVEHDPGFALAHMHLGLVYALRGDREQARAHLDLAIDLAGSSAVGAQAQRLVQTYFP